jgi:hypothetical protein
MDVGGDFREVAEKAAAVRLTTSTQPHYNTPEPTYNQERSHEQQRT